VACEFCGQPAITDAIREYLGIDVGETTPDGMFTLVELECLGACDLAPVALIDDRLHERLTPESVRKAIDEARNEGH
jgi:NADH:ubiquinone oxidoreductase subunit E